MCKRQGKPGETCSEEAEKIRKQLAKEADILQRMTNPLCANRSLLNHLSDEAGQAGSEELTMYYQHQKEDWEKQIAEDFARDLDISSDAYLKRFEDKVRNNPKAFPLLSRYYH
ncbi:MAG: hypothetical protein IJU76_09060 [Desulfovibrionaceae bacterium]|nr:hypothetical protein [Desulfovibrionaceae bacterium]